MTRSRPDRSSDEPLAVGAPVERPRTVLGSRPVRAVLLVVAAAAVAELVPALASVRVFSARPAPPEAAQGAAENTELPTLSVGEAELPTETRGRAEAVQSEARKAASPIAATPTSGELPSFADKEPKVSIVDERGSSLDGFFRALDRTRTKQPGAITRIVQFGDSIVASDYVSGTLRRKFQERFGDAGHGFTLIANAWPAYTHDDIERYATAGWKVSRVVGPLAPDGFYGLGCVSFRAERHALARFGTAKAGEFGRSASQFVVWYLAHPGGGSFEVSVDGAAHSLVQTHAEKPTSAFHRVSVPDGPHEFQILTKSGVSRLFGVVLERDQPGVVLDAVGIQGARIRFLDKQDDAHWAEQLAARDANLLIYEFGANESADGFLYPMEDYHRTMKEVLLQGQRALPGASCLVLGAMDRAVKRGDELLSIRVLPHIIAEQRRAAREVGCAFFDMFEAMGGAGSMARWVKRGLGQADLTHPTAVGSDVLGTWIFRALMQRYSEFVARTVGASTSGAPSTSPATSSPSAR